MDSAFIFDFLTQLNQNNTTEWFNINRPTYDKAKKEFIGFIEKLIIEISKFDESVKTVAPKDCLFRINRDIRFSKDKNPYKTNFGAYIVKGGKKSPYAGYYLHLEPDASFISGGLYMPMPEVLKSMRKEIFYNVEDYKKIIYNAEFSSYYGEIQGSKLTNPPKDFSKEFKDIDLIKLKDYYVWHKMKNKEFENKNIINEIISGYKILLPFNNFVNHAVYSALNIEK